MTISRVLRTRYAQALLLGCALPGPCAAQDSQASVPYSLLDLGAAEKPRVPVPYVEVAAPRPAHSAVTQHQGRFNGVAVPYTATVAETFIPGAANTQAEAALVTIAYTRSNLSPAERARRPVLFVFNGGPGAASTPLQGALAPRVHADGAFVDNPTSPLDAADLVFFDPVGSGYSQALPGKSAEQFWTSGGDAQSVRYLMQHWLKANGREASPRYLVGESYGTTRAGLVATIGADLNLDGIVLISSTGMPEGQDLPYVLSFPTYAAAAAFHGKGTAAHRDPNQVFGDNVAFARGRYLSALMQGDQLAPAEREAVAGEVAARLGLDKAFVLQHDLRIGNDDFMLNLLKDEGNRIGQLDARATGALDVYAKRHPPYDDPAMHTTGSVPNTPDHPAANPDEKAYLANELGYTTDQGYIGLNLGMLFAFRHDVAQSYRPMDAIAALMREQPRLRLMLIGGLYDITTPFYAASYNLAHAGAPRDRTTVMPFIGGHEVYGGKNLAVFDQAIRDFVKR